MSCAKTVGSTVKRLNGVVNVESDVSGKTKISYDKSQITIDKIKEAITELGYEVID